MAPGPTKPQLLQCQSPGSPTQVGNVWREGGTCTSLISSRWTLFILFATNRLKLAFRQFQFVIFSKGVSWKMFGGLQPESSCQTLLHRG